MMSLDSCLMSSNVNFRDTKEQLTKGGGERAPGSMFPSFLFPLSLGPIPSSFMVLMDVRYNLIDIMHAGLVIEEITEEVENVPLGNSKSSSLEQTVDQPKKSRDSSKSSSIANNGNLKSNSDSLDTLKKDPEAIR